MKIKTRNGNVSMHKKIKSEISGANTQAPENNINVVDFKNQI